MTVAPSLPCTMEPLQLLEIWLPAELIIYSLLFYDVTKQGIHLSITNLLCKFKV